MQKHQDSYATTSSFASQKKSHLEIEDASKLQLKSKLKWKEVLFKIILLQDKESWQITLIISIILNFFYVSYCYFFMSNPTKSIQHWFYGMCDIAYIVDVIFEVCIYSVKTLSLRISRPALSLPSLICDVVIALPFSTAYSLLLGRRDLTFLILRSFTLLRLMHLWRYFSEKSKSAGIQHVKYFIAQYYIYMFILMHVISCAWYLLAAKGKKSGTIPGLQNPIKAYNHVQWYILSFYFSVMNITSCGFGDIIPVVTQERVLTCVAMLLGFTLTTGILIGTLTSEFVNADDRISRLRTQIFNIMAHLQHIGISGIEKKYIISYYDILWRKKKGIKTPAGIDSLPLPLRMEIAFDVNYSLLQRSIIFKVQSEPFLRTVSLMMVHEFYQPGEIIYHQHVVKYKMICVASGVIEILSEEDNQSPIISFGAGTCLGEAALVVSLPAKATVRAAKYTELQVLYKKAFVSIITLYPETFAAIREMIFHRIKVSLQQASAMETAAVTYELNFYASHNELSSFIKRLKNKLESYKSRQGLANVSNVPVQEDILSLYNYTKNIKRKVKTLCLSNAFPWMLEPDSSIVWIWEFIILLNTLGIGVLYPYFISYIGIFSTWMSQLSLLLEALNAFDIYMILTTAIEDKNVTLNTFKQVLVRQLRTFGFYLDIASVFPLELITELFTKDEHEENTLYYCLKLNRVLKMYRVFYFFRKIEMRLRIHVMPVRLLKYLTYMLLCPYYVGVILFFETCPTNKCIRDGWFTQKKIQDNIGQLVKACTDNEVLMSFYLGLTCVSCTGFGDILVGNTTDVIFIILAILGGIMTFAYCTADLSATITQMAHSKVNFQETYFSLKKYMEDEKMSHDIKARVINFMMLQWNYNQGLHISGAQNLFYNASSRIQDEVVLKDRLETLVTIPMFKGLDMDLVQLVATKSRVIVLPPNEIVRYAGDKFRQMFVIKEGYCIQKFHNGTSRTLGPASFFGAINIVLTIPIVSTIISITHVKLITITEQEFKNSISLFPNIAKEFRELAFSLQNEADQLPKIKEEHLHVTTVKNTDPFQWFKTSFKGSFLNVPLYCHRRGEDYGEPFRNLKYRSFLKYTLLPLCILPDGYFIKLWVTLRFITSFMIAIINPFQQILAPYTASMDYLVLTLDIIAYIDLYVMMHLGYYGEKNQLIVHPLKTACHYLAGPFFVDLIFCFPWEFVVLCLTPEHNEGHSELAHRDNPHHYHCIYRMVRIFQIYRLPNAIIYLGEDIKSKGFIGLILKFIPLCLILVNFFATLLVITSCSHYHISDIKAENIINGSFVKIPGRIDMEAHEYAMYCRTGSWLDRSIYSYMYDPLHIYLLALYWTASTIVGCGLGDITPHDEVNIILITALMIIGVLFIGYLYASIASSKAGLYSTLSRYQELVTDLIYFFRMEKEEKKKQAEYLAYFEYVWKRTRGTEPNDIFSHLHPALHEDAVLSKYYNTLKEIPIFQGMETAFFRVFAKELRERYYISNNMIIRANDVLEWVFILYRGEVELEFVETGKSYLLLNGSIFGNLTSKKRTKISVDVSARSNVDTLFISAEVFTMILKGFPDVKNKINEAQSKFEEFIPASYVEDYKTTTAEKRLVFSKHKSSRDKKPSTEIKITMPSDHRHESKISENGLFLLFKPHKWFHVALLPDTTLFTTLTYIICIAAYINCILVIYQFCFQKLTNWWLALTVLLDLIFFWKMFLEWHKAYPDQYGEYETNNRRIAIKYFRNWMRLIDFIANLPIYYVIYATSTNKRKTFLFTVFRLITLLRFYYTIEFHKTRSNKLMANRLYLKLSSILIWMTTVVHTLGCLWYLCACPLGPCQTNCWMTYVRGPQKGRSDYIISLYFVIELLTTTASGDVLPTNNLEMVYTIFLMFGTKFMLAIFIGDLTCVLNSYTSSLVRYEQTIIELRDYLQNVNVSEHQMQKMWDYVKQLWTRSKGKQIPELISLLPYTNRCDLLFSIYGQHLKCSFVFSGIEDAFIRQLSVHLKHVVFFPGNYIVQHGDSDLSMYFVHRGQVDVLTVHANLTETIHDVLVDDEMFGLPQGLFYGVAHHFSYRARTTVDIISLQLEQWQYLLDFFPGCKEKIHQTAKGLYELN